MADINEEQLLNELLRDVGKADRRMSSADLEARVLAAWDSAKTPKKGYGPFLELSAKRGRTPFSQYALYAGIAAMVTIAVVLPTLLKPNAPVAETTFATEEVIATAPAPVAPRAPIARVAPRTPAFAPEQPRASALTGGASAGEPIATVSTIAQSPIVQAPIEFIPLTPMTERELTGSFQIVRVQMPRASLGPLALPTNDPRELVEADVLLGEDGVARGIRLSTNGSVYPWRPK